MKNLKEAYKFINKYIANDRIDNKDKFEDLFILICNLIDIISFQDEKRREHILNMLSEYDFKKNREIKDENNK